MIFWELLFCSCCRLAAGGSLEIAPIVKLVAAAVVFVIAAIALSEQQHQDLNGY